MVSNGNNNNSNNSSSNSSCLSILCSPAALWLFIWMVNNIGVTLLNKAAFAKVAFHYPWTLSAIHMICNYLGAMWVFFTTSTSSNSTTTSATTSTTTTSTKRSSSSSSIPLAEQLLGTIERRQLNWNEYKIMVAFSILFTLNIAIGNLSLNYVTVNFNQVMRSLVPAVTIVLGILFLNKQYSIKRKLSIVPIMVGVAMACFGDMSYTTLGFIVTVFCVILAALKAVASGEMLTGNLQLHPVDLLARMAPLAMIQCLIVASINGEIITIIDKWDTELNPITVSCYPMFVVWMSGFASFTLNISSFQANKVTSALTLCIAANVKQVLMIWLSTILFQTNVSLLNASGIAVVLAGSAYYSFVCLHEKDASKQQQQQTLSQQTSNPTRSSSKDSTTDDENDTDDDEDDIEIGPTTSNKIGTTRHRNNDINEHDNDDNNDDDDENNEHVPFVTVKQ